MVGLTGLGICVGGHRRHGIGIAPFYDNRFGTDTVTAASTGWFTFGLHPGSRRVWLNSISGSDANDGLSAATAKATVAGAIAVWLGAGFSAADQLMVAQGGTYSELVGNSNLSGKGGVSKTYPTAVLSYDPADAANAAKYGRATGSAMPVITFPSASTGAGQCLFSVAGDDGTTHNIAVQGIELKYAGNDGNGCQAIYVGRHDGICYQNCRFNGIAIDFPNDASPFGLSQGINVSKCSSWGQWTTDGNCSGFYSDALDGLYFQDCVFAHCGWKIGATRDDATTAGGVSTLGHNYYYHATNVNGRIDRVVSIDSATDGHNVRGTATVTLPVSLDNPIGANFTGISAVYSEAPSGSVNTVTDALFMGGDNINTANPRGYGIKWSNAAATGCSLTNALMVDNPTFGGVNNRTMLADASNTGVTSSAIALSRITAWNYAPQLQFISGTQTVALNWTTAITDTLASGAGNIVWNGATFPNAKTRDQVVSALLTAAGRTPGATYGTRKSQLVNLMLWRPDLDWARYLVSITFPAFNKTQTLASLSPPNLSATTPAAIYDATAPVLSLPTGTATGSSTATVGATTNEANGKLYYVVTTSSTQPTVAQIKAGQNASGTTAANAGSAVVAATGALTESATSLTPSTLYYVHLMHEDNFGNQSNIVTSASFTTSAGVSYATLSTASTDKYAGITLATGNLHETPSNVVGDWQNIRANRAAGTGTVQFDVSLNSAFGLIEIGVDDGTTDYSVAGAQAITGAHGVFLRIRPADNGWYIQDGLNGFVQFKTDGTQKPLTGDTISVVLTKSTGALKFFWTHSGTTVQLGTTYTFGAAGMTPAFTNYYAFGAGQNAADDMTFNFGATTQVTTGTGATAY